MSPTVRTGFLLDTLTLPIDQLIPTKSLEEISRDGKRYATIAASVREVGVIEPLVVFHEKKKDKYLLLDGHVRLVALRELGAREVTCLVSTDDESFTYNNRVNRIAPIQANRMILKAIDAGASEERIAKALNVSPQTIRANRSHLLGICSEAIELLKDKPITAQALERKRNSALHDLERIRAANGKPCDERKRNSMGSGRGTWTKTISWSVWNPPVAAIGKANQPISDVNKALTADDAIQLQIRAEKQRHDALAYAIAHNLPAPRGGLWGFGGSQ